MLPIRRVDLGPITCEKIHVGAGQCKVCRKICIVLFLEKKAGSRIGPRICIPCVREDYPKIYKRYEENMAKGAEVKMAEALPAPAATPAFNL